MVPRRQSRLVFTAIILLSGIVILYGHNTSPVSAAMTEYEQQSAIPLADRAPITQPSKNVTVVTGQGFDGESSAIAAFGTDGRVLYYNDTYTGYLDVDPSPRGGMTVLYVAEKPLKGTRGEKCNAKCTISVVERVNLTTGEVERLYSQVIPQDRGANWHDVDRLDENHLLIGDINRDEVFVVNTTSGLTTWEWDTQTEFPITEGGPYPADWAHLNDVEYLGDGRIMVSLRNQDQVVFLDRATGLIDNLTLGKENNYSILNEQHNPDYIPSEQGGPAVVIADSLNNRIVEYQRTNNTWKRTWTWQDSKLLWPRDADRLPNGNTLITDSNGDRVLEVNQRGKVVWRIRFYSPYDVERLGTSDESTGGRSAMRLNLSSRQVQKQDKRLLRQLSDHLFSQKTVSGIWFILPVWATLNELVAAVILVVTTLVWGVFELWNSSIKIRVRSPFRILR